jgi:hypothetical protein
MFFSPFLAVMISRDVSVIVFGLIKAQYRIEKALSVKKLLLLEV